MHEALKSASGSIENESDSKITNGNIKFAVVSCGGSKHKNAIILIKSAIISTSRVIDFHIITEKVNENELMKEVSFLVVFFRILNYS